MLFLLAYIHKNKSWAHTCHPLPRDKGFSVASFPFSLKSHPSFQIAADLDLFRAWLWNSSRPLPLNLDVHSLLVLPCSAVLGRRNLLRPLYSHEQKFSYHKSFFKETHLPAIILLKFRTAKYIWTTPSCHFPEY